MDILASVKKLTNEADEELLNILTEQAKAEAVEFCRLDAYDKKLDSIVIDLAVIRYNRLSNEGVSSVSTSGISESYSDDLPEAIKKRLRRYRRLITL